MLLWTKHMKLPRLFFRLVALASILLVGQSLETTALTFPPATLHIGGFFAPVSPKGSVYTSQAEHLAAFVMAVNDINNKNDGIYDDLLPDTQFEIAVGVESSLASAATNAVQLTSAFGGSGVEAAVSALGNGDALMVSQLLGTLDTLAVLSVSDSAEYGNFALYPSVANIRPLVSRQGMVVQNMICQSEARKVVVFASTDSDNIQMMSQFQDESMCDLDILAVITVRAELSDLSCEIVPATAMGSRYFVTFLPAHQNAWLIEQGYAANLFRFDSIFYTTDTGVANITQYFSPETDVAQVMTGVFYFEYYPNYYMGRSDEARSFARRWREQPSRAGQVVNGKLVCDPSTDDNGGYLYQASWNNKTICTGLDFSSYNSTGADIQPFTAITYDSTIMLAMAIDYAIRHRMNYKDPATILDIMVMNVSFTGATGPLKLFQGYSEYANNGRGIRDAGTKYKLMNFNPDQYRNGSDHFMVEVGMFDGDTRTYAACAPVDSVYCFQAVYTTETDDSRYVAPADTPPLIIFSIPAAFVGLCNALALIIMLLVLIFGLFMFVHRRSKVIKASQPMLLWCILLGGVLAALRIFFGGLPNSDMVCSGEVWFGHLAFVVMIGSLFVKSYRVHCIVNTRKLVRVTFSAIHAFRILVGIVGATLVFLVVTEVVGQPQMRVEPTIVANQETDMQYCGLEYAEFQTTLFVMEGFLLAVCFRVCWEIRNVPDIVNESKQISTAMSAIVMVSVLILPIVYFLGLSHYTQDFVASFGFAFGAIVTLTLLFVPKIMVQYHLNSARMSAKVAVEAMLSSKKKYQNGTEGTSNNAGTNGGMHVDADAEMMLKGKPKEEKLFICQEQLRRWQVLLLAQQRAALNSNSTSSNAHSSSSGISTAGPVKIEPSLLCSVVEAEPDFGGMMCDELFATGGGDIRSMSEVGSGTNGLTTGPGELMVEDV
jgi:hypothetical protein